jgi:hypothetical protein
MGRLLPVRTSTRSSRRGCRRRTRYKSERSFPWRPRCMGSGCASILSPTATAVQLAYGLTGQPCATACLHSFGSNRGLATSLMSALATSLWGAHLTTLATTSRQCTFSPTCFPKQSRCSTQDGGGWGGTYHRKQGPQVMAFSRPATPTNRDSRGGVLTVANDGVSRLGLSHLAVPSSSTWPAVRLRRAGARRQARSAGTCEVMRRRTFQQAGTPGRSSRFEKLILFREKLREDSHVLGNEDFELEYSADTTLTFDGARRGGSNG